MNPLRLLALSLVMICAVGATAAEPEYLPGGLVRNEGHSQLRAACAATDAERRCVALHFYEVNASTSTQISAYPIPMGGVEKWKTRASPYDIFTQSEESATSSLEGAGKIWAPLTVLWDAIGYSIGTPGNLVANAIDNRKFRKLERALAGRKFISLNANPFDELEDTICFRGRDQRMREMTGDPEARFDDPRLSTALRNEQNEEFLKKYSRCGVS